MKCKNTKVIENNRFINPFITFECDFHKKFHVWTEIVLQSGSFYHPT